MRKWKMPGRRMGTNLVIGVVAACVVWLLPNTSLGQEEEVNAAGRVVYEANCASCHGPNADGQGVVAQYLNLKRPI